MKVPTAHARTVISTDAVDSSAGGHRRHHALGAAAEHVVHQAMQKWSNTTDWVHRHDGDGDTLVVSAAVPKAWILHDFVTEVAAGIRIYNQDKNDANRLRLRVGLDCGDVTVDDSVEPARPTGGTALVHAPRYRDCDVVKDLMKRPPYPGLGVVLSDRFYQDVVPFGDRGISVENFRAIRVAVAGKESAIKKGWLYMPGGSLPALPETEHSMSVHETSGPLPERFLDPQRRPVGEGNVNAHTIYGGTQVGVVHGGFSAQFGASAPPTETGLTQLKSLIDAAHRRCDIDDESYFAAQTELAAASRPDAGAMPLRRLRGILADHAYLADAVRTLMEQGSNV